MKIVLLSAITNFDDVCWFHSNEKKPTCRAVASHAKRIYEADLSRPIILSASGIMMDGMHRVAKAWLLGMEEIQAVQFLADPPPDQILSMPEKKRRHNTSLNLGTQKRPVAIFLLLPSPDFAPA